MPTTIKRICAGEEFHIKFKTTTLFLTSEDGEEKELISYTYDVNDEYQSEIIWSPMSGRGILTWINFNKVELLELQGAIDYHKNLDLTKWVYEYDEQMKLALAKAKVLGHRIEVFISNHNGHNRANIFIGHVFENRFLEYRIEFSNPEEGSFETNKPNVSFEFKSSDHLRFENGLHVAGPHGGAPRSLTVQSNISGGEGYTVTLFNLEGGRTVQMSPKQMNIEKADASRIVFKGFGVDALGNSFSDYGLTVFHQRGKIEKCVLHMLDRKIDIEYLP